MKKSFIFAALICASFLVLSSCDSASNTSSNPSVSENSGSPTGSGENPIKDGTKIKITYVVNSAYFTLPSNAPKYHIYGTDTQLPLPEEKNLLGALMKAKFWSDGTRDEITVLGARDYTSEIRVEYKFSFDSEACAEGYVMIDGKCKVKAVCMADETYDPVENKCVENNPGSSKPAALGDACTVNPVTRIVDHGIVECLSGILQLTGCEAGYELKNGECIEIIPECTDSETACLSDREVGICVDGKWVTSVCDVDQICSGGACVTVECNPAEFVPYCDGNLYMYCDADYRINVVECENGCDAAMGCSD